MMGPGHSHTMRVSSSGSKHSSHFEDPKMRNYRLVVIITMLELEPLRSCVSITVEQKVSEINSFISQI